MEKFVESLDIEIALLSQDTDYSGTELLIIRQYACVTAKKLPLSVSAIVRVVRQNLNSGKWYQKALLEDLSVVEAEIHKCLKHNRTEVF